MHFTFPLIFVSCLALLGYVAALSPTPVVDTDLGQLRGNIKNGYNEYLGIPYIEPPLKNLRFQPPVPKHPWEGIFNATEFSAGCPQKCQLPPRTCPEVLSENCISLNIYTPEGVTETSGLPVVVFFPGGHFEQGGAGVTLYDGEFVVKQGNVILVTVSYRLGVLGWLALTKIGLRGNYGLMDQREALLFVQRNIRKFGGDPNRITISGQSAGAVSVAGHLLSKKSKGLFQGAILNSNPIVIPMQTSEYASLYGERVAELLKCDTLQCFQEAPIDAVVDAQYEAAKFLNKSAPLVAFMELTVYVDGEDITENALDAFREGRFQDVPLIVGSTSQEALIFIMQAIAKEMSTVEYVAFLTAIFYPRGAIAEVLYHYPPTPVIGDKRPTIAQLGTEYIFFCPWRYTVRKALQKRHSPIFMYEFNQTIPGEIWGPHYTYCDGSPCHGADLAYWFQALRTAGVPVSEKESDLMKLMTAYVSNFAYSGNPNKGPHADILAWPEYNANHNEYMNFYSERSGVQKSLHHTKCDFWDSVGKPYPYHFGFESNEFQKALQKLIVTNQDKD